jgi:hypothetical protein
MRLLPGLLAATLAASPVPMTRVDRVAAGLRQSPVFVDPEVSYLLTGPDRAKLAKQIAAAEIPIYLAVVPLDSDDESGGDADYFTYLLHRRLGRDGVYLVSDQRGGLDETSYRVPREAPDLTIGDRRPLPDQLHDAIDAYAHAPAAKPTDPRVPREPTTYAPKKPPSVAGAFIRAFLAALLVSGALLALLWLLGAGVVGAVRRRDATTLRPRRVRRMAWAELVRLARALGAAEEDDPAYARAMADYDAAKLLWDEKEDPGSRFAVVVLALDGQDALRAHTAEPVSRCSLNPLHGPAARHARTARSRTRQPMCAECAKATRHRPLALVIDGRPRPYYDAPGLWERLRGKRRDLPGHVLEYLGVE